MFRFSIRELMLVTLVVALGAGWWREYRSHAYWRARTGALKYCVEWHGYDVTWDSVYVTVSKPDSAEPTVLFRLAQYSDTADPASPSPIIRLPDTRPKFAKVPGPQ